MSNARALLGLIVAVAAMLAGGVAPASAAFVHPSAPIDSFGSDGTSSSSLGNAGQQSINQTSHRLYVLGSSAVHGFAIPNIATHTPLGGNFPFAISSGYNSLAADNPTGTIYYQVESNPSLYAFDSTGVELTSGFPIGGFGDACGGAVDSSGNIWVSDYSSRSVKKYSPTGVSLGTAINVAPTGAQCRIEFDRSTDDLYVATYSGGVNRYTAASNYTAHNEIDPGSPVALAVDASTQTVYLAYNNKVRAYDPNGVLIEEFATGVSGSFTGISVDEETGAVYLSDANLSGKILIFQGVIVPDATTGDSSGMTETTATVSGHLDPAGGGLVTECYFEYGTGTSYGSPHIPCSPGAPYSNPEDVTAELSDLVSGHTYHYRLVASNANGTSHGTDRTVTAAAPPSIDSFSSSNVTATTADLNAQINPNGFDTSYRFEYGTTSGYGSSAPIPDGEIPSGQTAQSVSVHLGGLQSTTYHFRVVAQNAAGTAVSEDQTFNFFPPPCPNQTVRQQTGSEYLPECRAYELVSPGNAGNIIFFPKIELPVTWIPPATYATNPARFAFGGGSGGITGTEPANGTAGDTYVATRTDSGWHTSYIGVPGDQGLGTFGTLANPALDKFIDFKCGCGFEGVPQPPSNAPYVWDAENRFLGRWPASVSLIPDGDSVKGAFLPSPDFSHLAFSSRNVAFAPNGLISVPGSAYDYNTKTGSTTIISKLPGGGDIGQEPGNLASTNEFILFPGVEPSGLPTNTPHPGVSTDGSHILMSTASAPFNEFTDPERPPVRLYMRVDNAMSYEVSRDKAVRYVGMTDDGSEVFFTSSAKLTTDDHDTSADLFIWREASDSLTRISSGSSGSGDTDACSSSWTSKCGVEGLIFDEGSTDNSIAAKSGDVYFYSPEQLVGIDAVAGERNLYVYRDGSVQFVATGEATRMQISPDGSHMAFISPDRVISYDNGGFEEMYTFDPASGKVRCVSCPPEGVSPTGNVSGSLAGIFMTDDGRPFFYTPDGLVQRDTNELRDVYEFVEGRPQLITTGTGGQDTQNAPGQARPAGLSGVSADGVNVYFATYETLVGQDENGQFLKFYDARTAGGFPFIPPSAPCAAADECHGPGSSPPQPAPIGSGNDLGSGGNVAPEANPRKTKANKQRRKRKATRRHHRHANRLHGTAR